MSKSLTDKKEWPKGMIFWPISLFDSTSVSTSIFLKRNVESRSSLLSWVKKSVQKVIFYTDIYEGENKKFGTNFSTYIAVLKNNSIECTDFQSSTDWSF